MALEQWLHRAWERRGITILRRQSRDAARRPRGGCGMPRRWPVARPRNALSRRRGPHAHAADGMLPTAIGAASPGLIKKVPTSSSSRSREFYRTHGRRSPRAPRQRVSHCRRGSCTAQYFRMARENRSTPGGRAAPAAQRFASRRANRSRASRCRARQPLITGRCRTSASAEPHDACSGQRLRRSAGAVVGVSMRHRTGRSGAQSTDAIVTSVLSRAASTVAHTPCGTRHRPIRKRSGVSSSVG